MSWLDFGMPAALAWSALERQAMHLVLTLIVELDSMYKNGITHAGCCHEAGVTELACRQRLCACAVLGPVDASSGPVSGPTFPG